VAVQGFGNVGSVSADLLARDGARLVAVADASGAIHDPAGIDVSRLIAYVADRRGVAGFPGAKPLSAPIVEYDCDILIPAALENQITTGNADAIETRLIVEGANNPVSPGAEVRLGERGIPIIPDILANAGGVNVSYFEWVQNKNSQSWRLEKIQGELEFSIKSNLRLIHETARRRDLDLRTAAYVVALQRLSSIYRLRGIFP
jgi:glutamate dehydrogenase (NAD(P)+)